MSWEEFMALIIDIPVILVAEAAGMQVTNKDPVLYVRGGNSELSTWLKFITSLKNESW